MNSENLPKLKKVSTTTGYSMFVLPKDNTVGRELASLGSREPETTNIIESCVKPKMSIIEIGSNHGFHSINIAKRIGPEGKLWCVETNPLMADILNKNLELNELTNTKVINSAISDKEGVAEFNLGGIHNTGCSSFENNLKYMQIDKTISATTSTLDALFFAKKVDGIKMDI